MDRELKSFLIISILLAIIFIFMVGISYLYGYGTFNHECLDSLGEKLCSDQGLKFNETRYDGVIGEEPFIACKNITDINYRLNGKLENYQFQKLYLYPEEIEGCKKR